MGKDHRHNKDRRQDPYRHVRRPTPPPPIFFVTAKEKEKRKKGPKTTEILKDVDLDNESDLCEVCRKEEKAPASLLCYECLTSDA